MLGCREITLERDTEQAIIAFRNRVAEMCNTEVTTEDAVEGDKPSNGFIENSVMLLRGIIAQEELREDSPVLPYLVEHAGSILSWGRKESRRENASLKGCTARSRHKSSSHFSRRYLRDRSQHNP